MNAAFTNPKPKDAAVGLFLFIYINKPTPTMRPSGSHNANYSSLSETMGTRIMIRTQLFPGKMS